ncbi:MAG TPA: TetR/AcrR family transcriptional regulator [Solirubrobacterales bacterium]|nr:TetR/AcrR family transcriptional regulator [Solirubrobacterales bacterium]
MARALPGWSQRTDSPLDPAQAIAGYRRQRILDATAAAVVERGFVHVSTRDIARAAAAGPTSFYKTFGSKQEAYVALLEATGAEVGTRVETALAATGEYWPDRVAAALRAIVEFAAAQPTRSLACLESPHAAGPEATRLYERGLDRFARLLQPGRALRPEGALLPRELELVLGGGVAWVLRQQLRAGDRADWDEVFTDLLGFLLQPYLGLGRTATYP